MTMAVLFLFAILFMNKLSSPYSIFSIEENMKRGGMGEMIASELKLRGFDIKMQIKAIDDEYITHASISDLNEKYGYTPEQIATDIERMLKS